MLAGVVRRDAGDVGVALQLFRRALALEQKQPSLWLHYGTALHDTHRYDDAREAFLKAAKMLPEDPMPLANVAASYVQQGKPRDAVEFSDRAFAAIKAWRLAGKDEASAKRAEHIAGVSKSYGCLALGRWETGWEYAQHLYGDTLRIRVYNPPAKEEPMWDGSKGKTVVVQADQGLGDMIMFSQCIHDMVKDCKKVIIETNPRLVSLFGRNFPGADVYGTLDKREGLEWPKKYDIDAHTHLSFLGKFYRRKDEDFPKKPYLEADPKWVKAWTETLEQYPKPWVGLAWRGGIQRTNEASRSLRLADLEPVINQKGTVISLCYQSVGHEVALWNLHNEKQVICPPLENDKDFDRTVGLVAALDQVVTATTTVAHVCGAIGKKAYVLVNQSPQWRYCYGGDNLVWYPNTLSLYRQKPGEVGWGPAVKRLADVRALCV